jgi:cytochrome P450
MPGRLSTDRPPPAKASSELDPERLSRYGGGVASDQPRSGNRGDVVTETTDALEAEFSVPDHVPPELVHYLDQWNGPDYLADPIGYWDTVREEYRVFYSPAHGGFWCLTRYDDVHEAFQRTELFSNRFVNIPGRPVRLLPISLDPPEHTKYRRLLNRPFSPAQIERLTHRIREMAVNLVEPLTKVESCDFMEDFASRLPTQVFCEILGLPLEAERKFLDWNYVIVHVQGDEEGNARQKQANDELGVYLADLVAQRAHAPRQDLISELLPLTIDGRPLSAAEAVDIVYLLFMAGLDTVISALCWAWRYLAQHDEQRARIVKDPSLIPSAVEELFRYFSFLQPTRTVATDVEFAGVRMLAGDRVMLTPGSVGRDERHFADAGIVELDRPANRHIAFGVGPHRCLGSHLARAEMVVAMQEWHQRIPDYRITKGATIRFHGGAVVGPDNIPLDLTPSSK